MGRYFKIAKRTSWGDVIVHAHEYITGNFLCFGYFDFDFGVLTSEKMIKELTEVLKMLADDGFTPNCDMRVDGWGNAKDENVYAWAWQHDKLPEYAKDKTPGDETYRTDQLCMLAFHLQRFLDTANKYPDCYWFSDEYGEDEIEKFFQDLAKEKRESESESENGAEFRILYRHPTRGLVIINSYEGCMEAYQIEYKKHGEMANIWQQLALEFPQKT